MNKFLRDQAGSISIEMLGIFSIFILIITLSVDVGQSLVAKNKLNNLSYSLASIIRERSGLYASISKPITQEEVDHLYEIASSFVKNSSIESLGIKVESLSFDGTTFSNQGEKRVLSFSKGEVECKESQVLEEKASLSFFTKLKTWNPVYQVTLCAKMKNDFFKVGNTLFEPVGSAVVYGK